MFKYEKTTKSGDIPPDFDISLRDRFAGQALQGILANEYDSHESADEIAKKSYEMADAMLKVRDKKND